MLTALAAISMAHPVTRTVSVYGYKNDSSKPAHGMIVAVPHWHEGRKLATEFSRGSYLRLRHGTHEVRVKVADVMASRFKGKRIDVTEEVYRKLGGTGHGLIKGVEVTKE